MKKLCVFASSLAVVICGCSTPQLAATYGHYDDGGMPVESAAPVVPARVMYKSTATGNAVANQAFSSDGSSAFFKSSSRMMAYTSGFTLSVKEREKSLEAIKKCAENLGGYLVSSHRGDVNVKIPVAKADKFLQDAKKLGKVSDFSISADDLTDTITDLNVRLDNLRKLRIRLTELLAKAQKVEDMLKVERELNRITTEIERMDAQLKNNKDRVNYVTFNISVIEEKGAVPGGTPLAIEHFSFLNKLASSDGGMKSYPLFDIDLPEGFVGLQGSRSKSFAATSSDDCIFRTWEVDIADKSTLDFWEKMICRTLQNKNTFDKIKTEPVKFKGSNAVKITAEVYTKRGLQSYMAVISIKECWGDDELRIVEFFGPQEAYKNREKAVTEALALTAENK